MGVDRLGAARGLDEQTYNPFKLHEITQINNAKTALRRRSRLNYRGRTEVRRGEFSGASSVFLRIRQVASGRNITHLGSRKFDTVL